MKKRTIIVAVAVIVICILSCISIKSNTAYAKTSHPLDEIQDYTIKVNPTPDGTLDITYNITWKVLDSTSEGPLTWVKIGAPNKNFEIYEDYSSNIKKISMLREGNDIFVRVDFNKVYEEDDVVRFYYTIHQKNMYIRDLDKHLCRYSFTPGWFDEIEVKHVQIMWNEKNVIDSNTEVKEDGYLIWEDRLPEENRLNASVEYNLDVFTTSEEGEAKEYSISSGAILIIIIVVLCIVVIIGIAIFVSDDYDSGSGLGGGHTTIIHSGGCASHSSCVHTGCACACACAGGGRAGCSKKDFYSNTISVETLKKVIEENQK